MGAALPSGGQPPTKEMPAAHVRGYDVRTGKRLWIFHTIPEPGEPGNETWENDSWRYTGNTGVWTTFSADPDLGYVYLPTEDPTGDYYGGHRLGDNLFGQSIVCLDARTGKRVWHYQIVHHDIWDYDLPAAPVLADIRVDGREIAAVAVPHQAGIRLRFRSQDRRAGVAHRGAAGARLGRAGGKDLPDAAVSHEARSLREAGRLRGRPHRLHPRAEERGARDRLDVPPGPALQPAVAGDGDEEGDTVASRLSRRSQLAGSRLRSRDRESSTSPRRPTPRFWG